MASKAVVAAVLAYLHEIYPTREIGTATAEAWAMTFADWSDDELRECAQKAAATPGRSFFPTPGEIAAFRRTAAVDGGAVLRRISALGHYTPARGWIYPRIETVRESLGDAIADAYATAGAERCFADDDSITQDIARRAFSTELQVAQREQPATPLLPPPAVQRRLAS